MKPPPWVMDAARAGYRRAPRWVQRPIQQQRHRYTARAAAGNRPALSVIMPVYNVERYLRQAVDSVLTQSFRDLELILVDDGSTDASGQLCDMHATRDPRIRVIHKTNEGLSAARNTGIAAARGDYLAFIDSDDYVLPGAYAAMMRSLQKSDSDLVTGNVVRLDGKRYTQSWNQSRSHLMRLSATTLDAHPELVFDTVTWNKIYRREFWDINVKAFPVGKLYEDIVPVFKAFLHAKAVDVLPRTVYVWRRRDEKDSITQRLLEPRNVADRFEMIDIVDELIRTHQLRPAVAERFHYKILEGDLWIYVRELTDTPDPAVQERLRQAVDRYWTTAPEALAGKMPAERRVAYWLVGNGRAADVPVFLRWYWDFGRHLIVTRPDGAMMLQASASPVSLDGIPEAYLRVGSRGTRSAASRTARRVYKRLPHRVRRPVVRARRGLLHQAQSSRQVVDRLARRPAPAADLPEAVIDSITCTAAGDLQISFATEGNRDVEAAIAPASGSPTWVPAERIGGHYLARIPTAHEDSAGKRRPLPSGAYRLAIQTAGGEPPKDVRVRVGGTVQLPQVFLTESVKVRVRPDDSGTVGIEIAAPIADDVLAKPAQAELRARYGRIPREIEDAVLFQVDVGFGSADSALAIGAELRRRGAPLNLYWGVEDLSVPAPEWATPVVKLSEDWYARLNGSRYIVNNYGGAWGLTKDPAQRYLQTWHGTPLKYIGVSEARQNRAGEARLEKIAQEAADWDAALSPSPYFTGILTTELLFTGRVLEVGYPRNDRLARATPEDREAVRAALGIEPDVPVLLYAPTYREGRRRGWRAPLYQGLDLSRLLAQLGPDWRVLLRGHSFNARHDPSDRSAGQVLDVTRHRDINDLYIASDVLVTDYSSVMFDYAVTGKPMAFFVPDLDHYAAVRGMYLNLAEIAPGPLCGDVTELADQLAEPDKLREAHADRYARFREQFAPWDDGNAAARVVDAFFED